MLIWIKRGGVSCETKGSGFSCFDNGFVCRHASCDAVAGVFSLPDAYLGKSGGCFLWGQLFPRIQLGGFLLLGCLWGRCAVPCTVCPLSGCEKADAPAGVDLYGVALFLMYRAFCVEHPLQFWSEGYYLPIVPPLLAGAAMVTAPVETLRGRKKKNL